MDLNEVEAAIQVLERVCAGNVRLEKMLAVLSDLMYANLLS